MSPGLRLYLDFVVFTFGAVIGSFLNVCVHRMPRGQSIVSPPSHCPHCDQPIRWQDNIPLISYLLLRRRCRHCRAPISPRYFLVELLTGTLFLLVWLKHTGWVIPIYWLLLAGLIAATFIDFEHYIIPNELTYGGIILGLVLSTAYPPLMGTDKMIFGLLRSALGFTVGAVALFVVLELGKLAFGKRVIPLAPGTRIAIQAQSLAFDLPREKHRPRLYRWAAGASYRQRHGAYRFLLRPVHGFLRPTPLPTREVLTYEEVFFRDSDRIQFEATTLQYQDVVLEKVPVAITAAGVEINGETKDPAQLGPVIATAEELTIPREAMGLGDVKLIGGIGAFLGWPAVLFTIFASSVVGGLLGMALVGLGKRELQGRIPYGPYIALGAAIWIFFGDNLLRWYLSRVGPAF